MSGPFDGKRILLGVSGSIAAYKAIDIASKLTQAGAVVNVLMSQAAIQFVTPLTFRSVTHQDVVTDLFDIQSRHAIEHVKLANSADLLVVAPATAHTIAKLALGLADDPITVTAIATSAPLVIVPAMDANMWHHPAVRANTDVLVSRGVTIVGPAEGRLASGLMGWGRLAETAEVIGAIATKLGSQGDLAGRTIVVSAGGTQEAIDPVRVITNRSSGKMGYAVAAAARDRGARVLLITASTSQDDPVGIETRHVESASEMLSAVLMDCQGADAIVMAAAVADYTPVNPATNKIKKSATGKISIELTKTVDILSAIPRDLVRVGFAAESTNLIPYAQAKVESKSLDFIVANDITTPGSGFGADKNKVSIVSREKVEDIPIMSKYAVANEILDRVAKRFVVQR